jgi:hypothetical protein
VSNRVTLVVLCEDEFHQQFANAFLNRIKLPAEGRRRIERLGSKERLLKAFPNEARAARNPNVKTRLVVLIDADERSDSQIAAMFRDRLKEAGLEPEFSQDPVLIVKPRWELENWALSLLGEGVGEEHDRNARRKVGGRGREAARALAEACQNHRQPDGSPSSLAVACREWEAHRKEWDY